MEEMERVKEYEIKINFLGEYSKIENSDCLIMIKGNINLEIKKEDNGKPIIIFESKQQ